MNRLYSLISLNITILLFLSCSPSLPGGYSREDYISIILEGETGFSAIPDFSMATERHLEILGSESGLGLAVALMDRNRKAEAFHLLSLIENESPSDFSDYAVYLRSFFLKLESISQGRIPVNSGAEKDGVITPEVLKHNALKSLSSGRKNDFSDFIKPFILLPTGDLHDELISAFESYGYRIEDLDPAVRELILSKKLLYENDYPGAEELLKIVLKYSYGAVEGVVEDFVTIYSKTSRLSEGGSFLSSFALEGTVKMEERSPLLLAAGRLFRWAGLYQRAGEVLEKALFYTDGKDKQRIIWYLLDCGLKEDPLSAESFLREYAPLWDEPEYFSDILEDLIAYILRERRWELLKDVLPVVCNYAAPDSVSQWLYVTARLNEEEICKTNISELPGLTGTEDSDSVSRTGTEEQVSEFLFSKIIDFQPDSYYSWLSRKRNSTISNLNSTLSHAGDIRDNSGGEDALMFLSGNFIPENEDLLLFLLTETGYYSLGLKWFELEYSGLPENDRSSIKKLAEKLQNDGRWLDSIRLISQLPGPLLEGSPLDELVLRYPRPYGKIIEKTAENYNHHPAVIYSLIRTESGFTPEIESWAGAVGLMQLMPSTAEDISSRIKMEEWDLRNPEDNLEMGTWYLDWLLWYVGGLMPSVLAYNGGPGRIKEFLKELEYLPQDLFPEALSIGETRRYGPKVLVSCIYYGYLYYGVSPDTVIEWFFPGL